MAELETPAGGAAESPDAVTVGTLNTDATTLASTTAWVAEPEPAPDIDELVKQRTQSIQDRQKRAEAKAATEKTALEAELEEFRAAKKAADDAAKSELQLAIEAKQAAETAMAEAQAAQATAERNALVAGMVAAQAPGLPAPFHALITGADTESIAASIAETAAQGLAFWGSNGAPAPAPAPKVDVGSAGTPPADAVAQPVSAESMAEDRMKQMALDNEIVSQPHMFSDEEFNAAIGRKAAGKYRQPG